MDEVAPPTARPTKYRKHGPGVAVLGGGSNSTAPGHSKANNNKTSRQFLFDNS